MPSNFLTTREAAHRLGVSLRTAQLWLEQGKLQGWKTAGGHRRITLRSVESLALQRHSQATQAPPTRALSVLIVEDDAALLRLYQVRLGLWPFPVHLYTAPNGYEGLVMVGEVRPDLLVCDLRLPGVNGFEIVRSLVRMERYRHLGIVVVTGLAGNEVEAHGGLPSQVVLMEKPLDFQRLEAMAHAIWTAGAPAP